MTRDVARRLAFALFLVVAVSSVALILTRLAPGDYATGSLGIEARRETIEQARVRYGLNKSIAAQYGDWLAHAVRFIGHSALMGLAACVLFTLTSGAFVRLAMVDETQGIVVVASLLLIGYWLRERRLLNWTRTPLMFEDEFPDQTIQLQL